MKASPEAVSPSVPMLLTPPLVLVSVLAVPPDAATPCDASLATASQAATRITPKISLSMGQEGVQVTTQRGRPLERQPPGPCGSVRRTPRWGAAHSGVRPGAGAA